MKKNVQGKPPKVMVKPSLKGKVGLLQEDKQIEHRSRRYSRSKTQRYEGAEREFAL